MRTRRVPRATMRPRGRWEVLPASSVGGVLVGVDSGWCKGCWWVLVGGRGKGGGGEGREGEGEGEGAWGRGKGGEVGR